MARRWELALAALFVAGLAAGARAADSVPASAAARASLARASSEERDAAAPPATSVLAEDEAEKALAALAGAAPGAAREALDAIAAARDARFVAPLVELVRAYEIGIVSSAPRERALALLAELSGQSFGRDWPAWVEWYGAGTHATPPGFTAWKGALLGRIDPQFAALLRPEHPTRIRVEEIVWGGVPFGGIPALDQPRTLAAADAGYLEPGEPVFGIALGGEARAYPMRILDWHELANDVVGGVPLALAYCTLCGAAIAFDARGADGAPLRFGSSGLLHRSNKLMVDAATRTLWNQLTGEPVLGPLAAEGRALRVLPVVLSSWETWRRRHPQTRVLDLDTGFRRPYRLGAPYGGYFASPQTMFPVWQRSRVLPAKARVYALRVEGVPKAYPIDALARERVVNDEVSGAAVVLVAGGEVLRVEGLAQRVGPVSYEAGLEVRAYRRGERRFRPGADGTQLLDDAGRPWRVEEDALLGPEGERAERLPGFLAYWFGWHAFFPQTLVYEAR